MEEIATGQKVGVTKGDNQVIEAEVRFEQQADQYAEEMAELADE